MYRALVLAALWLMAASGGADVDVRGFAAYELWHEALESEDVSPFHSQILRASRQGAAGFYGSSSTCSRRRMVS